MFMDEMALANGEPNHWQGNSCNAPPEAVSYYYHYTARIAPSSFGDWDFTEILASLTTPLLVIHGDIDSLAVLQQQAWQTRYRMGGCSLFPMQARAHSPTGPIWHFQRSRHFCKVSGLLSLAERRTFDGALQPA